MRRLLILIAFLPVPLLAAAADLTVEVHDPQLAPVNAARIHIYRAGNTVPVATDVTSAEGVAAFHNLAAGDYRVQVLAPGFAPASQTIELSGERRVPVDLQVAAQAATVEVSATRIPMTTEQSAAEETTLDAAQIELLNPISAAEPLRFLPGAVVSIAGQRGGISSLFVRGGESRYNQVRIDGVIVDDPGGTFDFGVVPMQDIDRFEFARGAFSAIYGSDAMSSVIDMTTRVGSTRTPELRFGGDGGNFSTAHGSASLSGALGRFDYNLFGDQFNTEGQGINDAYSNSSQGTNLGFLISPHAFFRFRTRHSNSRTGVQSFWNFNGQPLLPPDTDQYARQNNFLASGELTLAQGPRWQHRITGFEYNHKRANVDTFQDPGRVSPTFGPIDFPFNSIANINRAGIEYQGDYLQRSWAHATFGYRFEDENGFVGDLTALPLSHGLRRNHEAYGEESIVWRRFTVIGGVRYVHNESFGDKGIPRIAASFVAHRGGDLLGNTRLHFAYGTGIKEPRLEESFGIGGYDILPNPNLKPEQNRSFETGVQQIFFGDKFSGSATYFNNLFTNQIDFSFDPVTFTSQYVNVNKALAHGAELELQGRPSTHLSIDASYTYLSTQILEEPFATDPLLQPGRPLLRRPKHSGSVLISYVRSRWGGTVGTTAMSRRPDSDFEGLLPPVTYSAGYARMDLGAWFAVNHRVTAYANLENALDRHYEEAAGYPALGANIRAGLRFRIGGE